MNHMDKVKNTLDASLQRNETKGDVGMGFISLAFVAFLAIAVLVYYLLPKKIQWVWLLIVSLCFYLTFDVRYIAFLLFSILTTWGGALGIHRLQEKGQKGGAKWVVFLVIFLNLGLLAFLKYSNFAFSLLGRVADLLGHCFTMEPLQLLLPIAISFYSLQAVGYCIDIYRGTALPERNPANGSYA